MKSYRCPTCGKTLSKSQYEKALRIHEERERHFAQREAQLRQKEHEQKVKQQEWLREQRLRERKQRQEIQRKLQEEKDRVRQQERIKAARQQAGLREQLQKAKERLRQRARGVTPQTEGLEFEEKLAARLRKEFPGDNIIQKGKGGDVLHEVMFNKKPVGIIIYECKRTPSIQSQHVAQTFRAKQVREADFAVLVTTGKKKGFSGFAQMDGVSVVSPLAVLALVSLLRDHLIEMAHLKVTKERRAVLAQRLMQYIDSRQFKNPIEEVVRRTSRLRDMVKKEAHDHWHTWKERWTHYEIINWNTSQIQNNLRLVMQGGEPKSIARRKATPLQLPAPN